MKKIAKFEKVSIAQFTEAWRDQFGTEDGAEYALAAIPMPRRATCGSAGYDFALPYDLELKPNETA
ncbi:MAG: deoxyuridine 5'-triphosphate nucleotidohydrolase, partial [Firmicutes bacterium]|nr:deoxyuridine 5'-triphosphate nucleotidohydrolase [Bacillota bacterium]